jgi:hypothetical protein
MDARHATAASRRGEAVMAESAAELLRTLRADWHHHGVDGRDKGEVLLSGEQAEALIALCEALVKQEYGTACGCAVCHTHAAFSASLVKP